MTAKVKDNKEKIMKKWRAVQIGLGKGAVQEFGLWQIFWGTDIFINDVPLLKCLIVFNLIIWIFLK